MREDYILIGLILIAASFVSEINFHYIQKFMKKTTCDENTFWRAEKAEVFNSIFLMGMGIVMVVLGTM